MLLLAPAMHRLTWQLEGCRYVLLVLAAAACGEQAADSTATVSAPKTGPIVPSSPRQPDASTAEPVAMLAPDSDPWGPNAPPRPERPASSEPLPDKPARDAPEPVDTSFTLSWEGRPRVRVHMSVGNWRVNRPILIGGASPPSFITFNPSWYEANIDLELEISCGGTCEAKALPANIVASARKEFEFTQSSDHVPKLAPRWIVKPHLASGVWSWRFDASDKAGSRIEGHVAVDRMLPELGAVLRCRGETKRRANPVWLDRLEALCRELTFEVLP
jgi:hypothetical protein